ncbi:tetraspanin-1 [Talpa occidentalis]|uniref:tetraspanin-1 n=1 Tax=Talpa occidentalis TaxID=50954 RepID=UPI00188DD9AF|nr:tetraspanin-1 [Talpa occidentalis]XP_037356978.1 tetraspanin-1 [Talpa occidentalis]XP_054547260.1 tetraspanin-1 [Talpa occidentalis]
MQCFSFIKTLMIIFNLIIFLCGVALLAVGIWVSVDGSSFLKIFGSSSTIMQFVNVGYFLIAAGAVLFVLGFLGCYGAQYESKCALMMFFVILLLIFIAEVAAGVVVLVYSKKSEELLKPVIVSTIKKDYGSQKDITQLWNSTMENLKCCGFNNYTDFEDSPYFKEQHAFPPYCCLDKNNTAMGNCTQEKAQEMHVQGCMKQIVHSIEANSVIVGGVAAGIGALELAAMIVSMYVYCNLE